MINIAVALFCLGGYGTLLAIGWANRIHQPAFWPGYAVALPVFIVGSFLLIACIRKQDRKDRGSSNQSR